METKLSGLEKVKSFCVVGHTNTGKTSFLRTLLKDPHFGEVSKRPSTTRDVTRTNLMAGGVLVAHLYDTPGLEHSEALYQHLQQFRSVDNRHNPVQVLEDFLQTEVARTTFEQESKVIKQLLSCDAALFVIDTRTPVLSKYLDELLILAMVGKPIIPIFNFTQTPEGIPRWREALAQVHLHNCVEFDTHYTRLSDEQHLIEQCIAALPLSRQLFQLLLETRQQEAQQKKEAACLLLAELLINVGSYQVTVATQIPYAIETAEKQFKNTITQAENHCLQAILSIYYFAPKDSRLEKLPLNEGVWQKHSFDKEAWTEFGIRASTGVVAGGTMGAGVDLMFGGASLGAGTLVGAIAGGVYHSGKQIKQRLQAELLGKEVMQCEPQVLELLLQRQLQLIRALTERGHASVEPVTLKDEPFTLSMQLQKLIKKTQANLGWSQLANQPVTQHTARQSRLLELQKALLKMI